ncbi:heterokaryon incompatibility [Cadophora sp. DSE1049]|nr:heterokaryon incompatibility [Cadophora sp. DSE1049]
MRLLELNNHGDVSLTRNFINNIPPYAILSHTWGEDDEEVTFQDLTQGVGKSKAGYGKIRFCGRRAAKDSLQYVWIDTCCIDKSNSTELSEALNSMFRWYSEAVQCYVYLSDVSARGSEWEPAFRKSRWFTRGWTLQELLAPKSVEFFSGEGEPLGSKNSLDQQVREITGIPIDALQGKSLSSFPVPVRISWTRKRETKREEDMAYSLMGIFGIHMSPIYGEGKDEAFERLYRVVEDRSMLF